MARVPPVAEEPIAAIPDASSKSSDNHCKNENVKGSLEMGGFFLECSWRKALDLQTLILS
jgi:hypothetical protein